MLRGGIGYGGRRGGRGGECIKQGAADRIERASASPPLIGSDIKMKNIEADIFLIYIGTFTIYI